MMNRATQHCPGPMSRRKFLKLGAMSLGGLGLANLPSLRAAAKQAGQSVPDTSVIFVWLPGGPPHMETYDMKPDAPEDYRGEFRPIHSNVAGIDVCEHLPLHAKCADKYSLIRSISHGFADHGGGHKKFLTGRDPKEPTGFVNDYPMVGSMAAKVLEKRNVGVPNYVCGCDNGRQGIDVFSFGTAYLGPAYGPFFVPGDPSDKSFSIQNLALDKGTENRLDDRANLLGGLDKLRP